MPTPRKRTNKSGATTWQVRFRHGTHPVTGKPLETSESFPNEADATRFAKWVAALGPADALERLYADEVPDVPTLNAVAADHIRYLTGIEEGTRLDYQREWARTWGYLLGGIRADEIGPDQIREAVNDLAAGKGQTGTPYATKSLENLRGLLAGVLTRCIEKGYLTKNPAKGIRLPEGKRSAVDDQDTDDDTEMVCLTHLEWDTLYDAAPKHYQAFLRFLIGTGCRWGEAVVLRPTDFDLDAGIVRIRRALKWSGDGNRVIGPPKTKKGKRTIKLAPENIDDLRRLLEGKGPRDYVFTQARGGMISHRNFWSRVWKPTIWRAQQCDTHRAAWLAKGCKCGTATPARCLLHKHAPPAQPCGCAGTVLQAPRIHDLRHSHASWLLANGIPIHVVQARLGHESIQTTVDTYSHLLPDAQRAAAEAASLAFAGTTLTSSTPRLKLDAVTDDDLRSIAAAIATEARKRGVKLGPTALPAA